MEYFCCVCDSVFYKDCVLEMKDIYLFYIEVVEKVNISVGWSCLVCVRIFKICILCIGNIIKYFRYKKNVSVKIFNLGYIGEKLVNLYICF